MKEHEESLSRAKAQADAGNQAKTAFLANMRHDVRTPLTGIIGFSELLKSESTEPRIKDYADNLVASSHALSDFMDEVLEAVRVSSGDIPTLKRKFNLPETLTHIQKLCIAKAHQKRLTLSLVVDNNLPTFVIGDKIRLHRIVLELVSNALNFTDRGHVTIEATLIKSEHRQLIIKLTVSDSGIGMPKDKQQDIYLHFKRLTPSYQGIYKGAGLGLYVVKQFIDELGGEIYVDSELRQGTIFTCLIPLQESLTADAFGIDKTHDALTEQPYLAPLKHSPITTSTVSDHQHHRPTVLVVEDNHIAQTVAQRLLGSMSCQVDVAANGTEALARYKAHHYDLIFMDIGLGDGMDGYEVTYQIRALPNSNHYTPIIALTAHGGDENKQRCIEAGMDAVLTKPLTRAQALDMIKTFIPSQHASADPVVAPARRDLPDDDRDMFQLDQFALLDHEQALTNCGTPAVLHDLLNLLLNDTPTDLARLKQAFNQQDYDLVEKIAHKLKGGAVYVGAYA